MNSTVFEYYRYPENFADFAFSGNPSGKRGYFRFGSDVICYGRCAGTASTMRAAHTLYDAVRDVVPNGKGLRLPFDPSEVIQNLRYERYAAAGHRADVTVFGRPVLQKAYYLVRPLLPVKLRKHLQRLHLGDWKQIPFPAWPVDSTVEVLLQKLLILLLKAESINRVPFIWFWPNGFPTCAIMTHDVEEAAGRDFCSGLMDIDEGCGIKSSFALVPENRYAVPRSLLDEIGRPRL